MCRRGSWWIPGRARLLSAWWAFFSSIRVLGAAIPFHRNFEEVNLRYYVRQAGREDAPRAVAFVKEIVPLPAIAWTARLLYGEKYVHLPMQHQLEYRAGIPSLVEYRWRHRGRWQRLGVKPLGSAQPMEPGSEEEFIAEHYWGYAGRRSGTVDTRSNIHRGAFGRSARLARLRRGRALRSGVCVFSPYVAQLGVSCRGLGRQSFGRAERCNP